MKKKFGTKFVFDMRGFYADERIDGGLWNIKNIIYKQIYLYFKKKEKQFLSNADYIISLTENAKAEILKWELPNQPLPIQVIPCCADLELFKGINVNEADQKKWKEKLKIVETDFILSYLGSLGTWYLPDEMLDFFKVLWNKNENAKFLFITPDDPESIINSAKSKGIPENKITIQKADRIEVPVLLSLSKVSIFFIKPVFSKRASSPTKMGEIMGMGIPIICNGNVGDVDEIINVTSAGIIIKEFNEKEYESVINEMEKLLSISPEKIRQGAENYFSLKNGIEKYNQVYNSLKSE
jgi:glycosyltransferase involved in cell wall biosynthesis